MAMLQMQVMINLFVLPVFENIKEMRSKSSQGSVIANYQEAKVELINTKLNNFKSAEKN